MPPEDKGPPLINDGSIFMGGPLPSSVGAGHKINGGENEKLLCGAFCKIVAPFVLSGTLFHGLRTAHTFGRGFATI